MITITNWNDKNQMEQIRIKKTKFSKQDRAEVIQSLINVSKK